MTVVLTVRTTVKISKIRCTTDLYFQWANQKKANFQMKMWAINELSTIYSRVSICERMWWYNVSFRSRDEDFVLIFWQRTLLLIYLNFKAKDSYQKIGRIWGHTVESTGSWKGRKQMFVESICRGNSSRQFEWSPIIFSCQRLLISLNCEYFWEAGLNVYIFDIHRIWQDAWSPSKS